MKNTIPIVEDWRKLDWRNPFWELLRFYCSLRGAEQKKFLKELAQPSTGTAGWRKQLGIGDEAAQQIVRYCDFREKRIAQALARISH